MTNFAKLALSAAATAATALTLATPASAATIINGSFEQGVAIPAGGFVTLGAGSTAITGWTVGNTPGGIDYKGTYWQAADGSRSIDLAGNGRGSIYQDVTTEIGQRYAVGFYLAGNPDGGSNVKVAVTSIVGGDAQVDQFTVLSGINTRQNMGWTYHQYNFTAMSTTSRLTFASANAENSPYGPALDNVSIAAVPEPATWGLMILGFGLVGSAARSRRRFAVTYA